MLYSTHDSWRWAIGETVLGLIAFLLVFMPLYRVAYRSIRRWRLWQTPAEHFDQEAEPIADPRKHPLSLWEWMVFPLIAICFCSWSQSIPMIRTMYYTNRADLWRSRREGPHAVALYHKALMIDPESGLAHDGLGQALEVLGRKEEALREFDMACRFAPEVPSYHRNYALLLIATGYRDQGIQEYYRCTKLDVQDYVSHNALANELVKADRISEAVVQYRLSIQFNPGYPEPHLNLAAVLQLHGRYAEAIEEYRKVLLDQPDDPQVHNNMGRLLYSTGKTAEAIKILKHATVVAPRFALPYYNLGKIMQETGKRQESIEAFRHFVDLAGDTPAYVIYVLDAHSRLSLLHKPGAEFMHSKEHQVHLTALPMS